MPVRDLRTRYQLVLILKELFSKRAFKHSIHRFKISNDGDLTDNEDSIF